MREIAVLIRSGALVPVTVFGSCDHPVDWDGKEVPCHDDDHWGYGLCDLFSEHQPGGSDCNRADKFLLRPSDEAMRDPDVAAAIQHVLKGAEYNGHVDSAAPATREKP